MNNSKLMMIVMIVMLLLLIGVVGVGAYFIMGKLNAVAELPAAENVATTRTHTPETYKQSQITTVDLHEPISVNLLDSADGTEHAIRLSLGIGVVNDVKKESEELITLITENQTPIRDLCNVALRSKTKEDLSKNADGITALKEEILSKLLAMFSTDLIYEVYVGDIYWQ